MSIRCTKAVIAKSYFTAKGTAAGPIAGTFSAHGMWNQVNNAAWVFHESFKISSRGAFVSGKIHGSGSTRDTFKIDCTRFGPATLTYTAGSTTGKAAVEFRGRRATQSLEHFSP